MKRFIALLALFIVAIPPALAYELQSREVIHNVYALVGSLEARTYENQALNATFGFVVTENGVVLIDSGASAAGARIIEAAIHRVTSKPVRWVINTGSQDHRWLGNDYFAKQGAEIIALKRTVSTQKEFGAQWLTALKPVLKENLNGTTLTFAPRPILADRATINLGGRRFELIWPGDAHFAGDAVVWMPNESVLFSGDLIFVDRLLGVLPGSHVVSWRKAYHVVEMMTPKYIIPGHGKPCVLETAKHDTGDYLDWLVKEVGNAATTWEPIGQVVERLADTAQFRGLHLFDLLHKGNISRTYLEFEGT